jgi:Zn-dependent protease
LAVFNLLPVPPLDGSWILAGVLPSNLAAAMDTIRPYSFILLIALLLSGVFGMILNPILRFVGRLAL